MKKINEKIRTRFAPSPTGHLHIGNARTAIMNWICAHHYNGDFVLRIEDTDRSRSTDDSERNILDDLKWLGLFWDEGPDCSGRFGPYRQSERMEFYRDYLKTLQTAGLVYPCYCLSEELEIRRKTLIERGEQPVYNGRCRNLIQSQIQKYKKEGRKPVFRFRVDKQPIVFQDLVKGKVSFHGDHIGDFVIARSNGMPTYNFACVVDDHEMEISHIIRGDDHVSNTPRQILLYQSFGWSIPYFAHIPMILGKDRIRLSKRHGATSVSQYREMGYLSDTLINFLSLLSWSSKSGEEILSKSQLVDQFDFKRISQSAAVFDSEKLNWMNGLYIRNMAPSELVSLIQPFFKKAGFHADPKRTEKILSLLHDKLETLSEVQEKAKIFFQSKVVFKDQESIKLIRNQETRMLFQCFLKHTKNLSNWNQDIFKQVMKKIQEDTAIKGRNLWMPIRLALTGEKHGPDLPGIVELLGLEQCCRLIEQVLNNP